MPWDAIGSSPLMTAIERPLCGVLLLDKPLGLSSSQATQRVRRLLGGVKAGHVGSLDPLATGMLPICLGEATKVAGEIVESRKQYSFRIALGQKTTTGDREGQVVEESAVPPACAMTLAAVLESFIGESQQIPPMYSALKHHGQPLYKLARAGVSVERAARSVRISSLIGIWVDSHAIDCQLVCSKGTYVRVLAEDLAHRVGTCGHVAELRRDWVEPFEGAEMMSFDQLTTRIQGPQPLSLLPPDRALPWLPTVQLNEMQACRLRQGQRIHWPSAIAGEVQSTTTLRVYDESGVFVGLANPDGPDGLRAKRLMAGPIGQIALEAPPPSE